MLPAGSARSLGADSVDGVLENVSQEAWSDLAEREEDVVSALRHNLAALAQLRRPAEHAAVSSPVAPPQPKIVDAKPGQLRGGLHPR